MDDRKQIDLVYTYVDGSDPKWLADYNKYRWTHQVSGIPPDGATPNRYSADLNEIYYSICSIQSLIHKSIINRIYIVVSNREQFTRNPKFDEILRFCKSKLKIITHEDIIPSEYLPIFNSSVIELWLHKIPNLLPKFIYFNDDIIVNDVDYFSNMVNEFSQTGVGIAFLTNFEIPDISDISKILESQITKGSYDMALNNSLALLSLSLKCKRLLRPEHGPFFLHRTLLETLQTRIDISIMCKNRFRHQNDVLLISALHLYEAIDQGLNKICQYPGVVSYYLTVNASDNYGKFLFCTCQDDFDGDMSKWKANKECLKFELAKLFKN